jgi:hypothetical protein
MSDLSWLNPTPHAIAVQAARILRLAVPPTLLARADEVIE